MTDNERRRIFGLSKQLGINTEELHLIIHGVTGCERIKERRQRASECAGLSKRY